MLVGQALVGKGFDDALPSIWAMRASLYTQDAMLPAVAATSFGRAKGTLRY